MGRVSLDTKVYIYVFKILELNLKCASDHFPLCPVKDFRWLIKYKLRGFNFVAHTACYCVEAIHLSGNVWIICLYAQGKMALIVTVA